VNRRQTKVTVSAPTEYPDRNMRYVARWRLNGLRGRSAQVGHNLHMASEQFIEVTAVTWRDRASRAISVRRPFAVCAIDQTSLSLGFRMPWSRRWSKRWTIGFSDIGTVFVDGNRFFIRENDRSFGEIVANTQGGTRLEGEFFSRNVKIERTKLRRLITSRNRK
jgi:hypothetical protein